MMNCREVSELCSQEMDRPLKLVERVSLGTHVMMCAGCSNFRSQMRALRQIAQAYAQGQGLPTDAGENKDQGAKAPD